MACKSVIDSYKSVLDQQDVKAFQLVLIVAVINIINE